MARASRDKGKKGEREVAAIFRRHGWFRACPTPGSGAMRPYGAGDLSPWPGDLAFTHPFIVEVKRDERAGAPSRGHPGESFIRGVLKEHFALTRRHSGVVGGPSRIAVLVARASLSPWRFFVAASLALEAWGSSTPVDRDGFVELDEMRFFEVAELLGLGELDDALSR